MHLGRSDVLGSMQCHRPSSSIRPIGTLAPISTSALRGRRVIHLSKECDRAWIARQKTFVLHAAVGAEASAAPEPQTPGLPASPAVVKREPDHQRRAPMASRCMDLGQRLVRVCVELFSFSPSLMPHSPGDSVKRTMTCCPKESSSFDMPSPRAM
jgi:hypothetical protein